MEMGLNYINIYIYRSINYLYDLIVKLLLFNIYNYIIILLFTGTK